MKITFNKFNHSKGKQICLIISKQINSLFCPALAMEHYLKLRPCETGPLFIFPDSIIVKSSYFNSMLKAILICAIGSCKGFPAHSFRIGAATHCLRNGYSKDII